MSTGMHNMPQQLLALLHNHSDCWAEIKRRDALGAVPCPFCGGWGIRSWNLQTVPCSSCVKRGALLPSGAHVPEPNTLTHP